MGFKKYNRKSVFVALLLSFILILLFPVTVNGILYNRMESVIKENANRNNYALLKQTSQVVDNQLHVVTQLSAQISFNPKLQLLLNSKFLANQESVYKYVNFMNDLENYRVLNDFIHDYYVFISDKDMIISSSAKTDAQTFYRSFYRYEDMDYEQWRDRFFEVNQLYSYLPSSNVFTGMSSTPERMITYLQPLPYGETKHPEGYLAILIHEQQIKEMLQNIEWANRGDIYILDKDNRKIMTTAEKELSLDSMDLRLTGNSGLLEREVDQQDMMVSYIISKETGWKYISIVPKSLFMQKVNAVKAWALSLLIVCLIGGLITSYLLAYRHYVPVRDLVQSIIKKRDKKSDRTFNEYHLIEETLLVNWDTEKELRDVLTAQTPKVKANFLSRLIQGFVDQSASNRESLEFMDITFTSDDFAVLVVDVDDSSHFAKDVCEKQWAIIRFIIENVSEELANDRNNGYSIELDRNRLALLINFNKERMSSARTDLDTIANTLKEIIEKRFSIFITIGIGEICEGVDNVGKSYREALQALEYRMIKGQSKIIYFHEIRDAEHHYYYPIEMELQLMNFIKTADFENADKILDNVFKMNFESRNISLEHGKCLFFNVMSTLIKILNDININYESIFEDQADPVQQLANCHTAEEMHAKMEEIYKLLCMYMKSNRSDNNVRLLSSITDYIDQNYADSMLSLTSIADELSITPQYLSSFFKKNKGENITDYIAKARLEYAKNLLAGKKLTISEIAIKIGYANDIGLIRLFKKYEGITPGKYRTNLKN
ncbi:helix-turn-helix domain-containing protein [Paenibacillus alkaliterrae]|uniref:helix-turn-helix domain-containing protein n=1 Tax=Paenibacillus alkaliterrae TaxID=320909 RepID=UPI001F36B647|nr:helix-turn-helix domain-containing protein [Paenibacillus alkaliterrae]MCF2938647.1 helix-turn-helix domain-containing protein [Paenibacillus alkaliterrae]